MIRKNFILLWGLLILAGVTKGQNHITLDSPVDDGTFTASGSITLAPGFEATPGEGEAVIIAIDPDGAAIAEELNTAPSADRNYIITYNVRVEALADPFDADNLTTEVNPVIQYFDDLGRPDQLISVKGSPSLEDIVQHQVYDIYGREGKKYLPYADADNDGSYKTGAIGSTSSFYHPTPPSGIATIDSAYSDIRYEHSPLNRVVKQSSPGSPWAISGSNTVRAGYGKNAGSEIPLWTISGGTVSWGGSTYYAANTLNTDTLTDENGSRTITYKDLRGKVVLKKAEVTTDTYLSTFYVYDDIGNLAYVIPPGVTSTSFTESSGDFNNYVYAYRYDSRNRVVKKKIPGKGWDYLVYNKLDQVILAQDSVQRGNSEWAMTRYDAHGRAVMTGIYSNGNDLITVQAAADGVSPQWESRSTTVAGGYTANTYPTSGFSKLTINYYDGYSFPGGTTYSYGSASSRTKGLLTGSKALVLGTSDTLLNMYFYNDEGRIAKSFSQHYKGGSQSVHNREEVENTYNKVTGELLESGRKHYIDNSGSDLILTATSEYEYDHTGRKRNSWMTITPDGGSPGTRTLISQNDYNAIGQVMAKKLHSEDEAANFIETINYTYNPRGWTSRINSPKLDFKLYYETVSLSGADENYNGNISEIWYNSAQTGDKRNYYLYDKLNRLTESRYHTATSHTAQMDEEIAYNSMGNITSLVRGSVGGLGFDYSGTLAYTSYTGNKVNTITRNSSGFRSYSYDGNGNATSDGTVGYTYNHLNLPAVITAGSTVTYTYDATGRKLRKVISGGDERDYIAGIEYLDGSIEFVQTEEGRARPDTFYDYEYTLKDHLGNVRFMIEPNTASSSTELQSNEYYAFGLNVPRLVPSPGNKYTYNGKELQDEFQQYDYGARFYDPVTGRWGVVDPMSEDGGQESLSQYHYVRNNPINRTDPDGRCDICKTGFQALRDGYNSTVKSLTNAINSLPKFDINAKITFGVQAGFNVGKLAGVDVSPLSVTLADTRVSVNKGEVTKSESVVFGVNNRTGQNEGLETENKVGINVAGLSGEAAMTQQTYIGQGQVEAVGSKEVYKYGLNFNFSDVQRGDKAVDKNAGVQNVIERQYGATTKQYTEQSYSFSFKFLLGAELKINPR